MLFGLVWIDQNYENSTESRSFYMKIAYNILPTKGKERPALPSDGSGAWKLVTQNPKKEMDMRQVHKGFSSFIEKYLPYLKFFQSGAIQYFYWLQSPKCLILGTHYAYSNRVGLDKRLRGV